MVSLYDVFMPAHSNWSNGRNLEGGGLMFYSYAKTSVSLFARRGLSLALAAAGLIAVCQIGYAQSTFGTVLGTVKDPSGAFVPMAKVDLTNTGTNAVRTTQTSPNGDYQFVNVDVGTYKITVEAAGFQKTEFQAFDLAARETKRLDVDLKVATQAESVTVEAVAVVTTDAANIAETKGALELTDLPVAIGTRSQGSTSAFSTLTAQPGVQTDGSQITVSGAGPSQLSISLDGISSVGPGSFVGITELFPSFNSIEEIKISENLNPPEYGGVADITTISKSGTNTFHGGLFENFQNTDMNAADTFSHLVTPVKLNDFGAYVGGPVVIPGIYNGHDKTFFFISSEVLRLPKSYQVVESVPSLAMRSGDLTAYNPSVGAAPLVIPQSQINPYSIKLMNFFFPQPNYGPPGAVANNYVAVYDVPINSAQWDARVDHVINSKHSVFARYSYKNRRYTTCTQLSGCASPDTPLEGVLSEPEIDNSLTAAWNWIVSPTKVNELRIGFTRTRRGYSVGPTAQQAANTLGLMSGPGELPQALPPGQDIPGLTISGYVPAAANNVDTNPREQTWQALDNWTWTKGQHTLKFGGDFRYLETLYTNVFANYRMGSYQFNGSSTGYTAFQGFLLGYPDLTTISTVINPTTDAYNTHYAAYAQDDWKVSRSLTLNYGLRWEYHPGFKDWNDNMANFDPYYSSTINGQLVKGAVILPDKNSFINNLNPGFVQSIAPTPIFPASQLGIPSFLRFSSKKDFAPRIGFAWRVGGSNKTVLRGGYGRFIETLLGGSSLNGWSVGASDVGFFSNSKGANGLPVFSLPYSFPANIAQPGSQFFDLATEIHYKDPIVEEWNLTLERALGKGIGVRASYTGNHSYNIPTDANYNQPPANTNGFFSPATQAAIPFPLLAYIATSTNKGYGTYNAGTVSIHKRAAGLQFEASYTFTRNLTDAYGCGVGTSASTYVNEFGNTLCDPYHPGLDYGNVPFDRRHRFLANFLYQLPFGRGKTFLSGSSKLVNELVGGWTIAGIFLFQSGPFMSVTTLNDPSGTGYNIFGNLFAIGGRADTAPGVSPYAGQSNYQWINPAAFTNPASNIGRFGDSQEGYVVGPGTAAVSASLLKRFAVTERVYFEFGAQAANVINHPNYAVPANLTLGVPAFAQISAMQSAEGAGPRQLQLTGRFIF
jgi:hypothetical protein